MKNSSPRGTVRPGPGHHKQYGALAGWRAVRGGGGRSSPGGLGGCWVWPAAAAAQAELGGTATCPASRAVEGGTVLRALSPTRGPAGQSGCSRHKAMATWHCVAAEGGFGDPG